MRFVCFEDRSHETGVSLGITGVTNTEFSVIWETVTDVQRTTYNDLEEGTEHGAYGVAIIVPPGMMTDIALGNDVPQS